jgi:hydroxymethylbilane synthase
LDDEHVTAASIRIGTRGSAMALAQAEAVLRRLLQSNPWVQATIETVAVTGDAIQDQTLAGVGGKALFCKELEFALLSGQIDAAVHSCKDVATFMPSGLVLAAVLPREDCRDALVSRTNKMLDQLPPGSRIGTASVRRRAQLLALRPDLCVLPLRGNVNTRLSKLDTGVVDAIVVGAAGMGRIGLHARITEVLAPERMLPAPTQATVVVQIREDNERMRQLLQPLHDEDASCATQAERAFLAALGANCNSPLAAMASLERDSVRLRAQALSEDGQLVYNTEVTGPRSDAASVGGMAGTRLKDQAGSDFFSVPDVSRPAL